MVKILFEAAFILGPRFEMPMILKDPQDSHQTSKTGPKMSYYRAAQRGGQHSPPGGHKEYRIGYY